VTLSKDAKAGIIRRLILGFAATAFFQFVMVVLQLCLVSVFASRWGLALYGVWLILAAVPNYLALSGFGFATAAATDMTMKVAHDDFEGALTTFQTTWVAMLTCSSLICVLGLLGCWMLPDQFIGVQNVITPVTARFTLSFLIVYGLLCLQGDIFFAGLRCNGNFAVAMTVSALTYLSEGLIVGCMVILGGSPVAVAAAYATVRLVGVIILALTMQRYLPWLQVGMGHVSKREAKRLFAPSIAAMALPFSQACFLQGTVLAVGAGASPAAVATFTTVRTLTRTGIQLGTLFNQPMMPEFTNAYARKDRKQLAKLFLLTISTSALVLIPVAFVLFMFGPQIVSLWTRSVISPSWLLISLMTFSMLINGLWNPVSNLLLAMNFHHFYTYPYAALSFLSVALTYLLASHLGSIGGALSILILDIIMFTLVAVLASRLIATPLELARIAPETWNDLLHRLSSIVTRHPLG
jgi:O-antigen/teichoic acid export membrane protein